VGRRSGNRHLAADSASGLSQAELSASLRASIGTRRDSSSTSRRNIMGRARRNLVQLAALHRWVERKSEVVEGNYQELDIVPRDAKRVRDHIPLVTGPTQPIYRSASICFPAAMTSKANGMVTMPVRLTDRGMVPGRAGLVARRRPQSGPAGGHPTAPRSV
jgi:hypothetical protein